MNEHFILFLRSYSRVCFVDFIVYHFRPFSISGRNLFYPKLVMCVLKYLFISLARKQWVCSWSFLLLLRFRLYKFDLKRNDCRPMRFRILGVCVCVLARACVCVFVCSELAACIGNKFNHHLQMPVQKAAERARIWFIYRRAMVNRGAGLRRH